MTELENPAVAIGLSRRKLGEYRVLNSRGGVISIGDGKGEDFTPVELLLAALAGCSAVDVDVAVSRHERPRHFQVSASGVKQRDASGNKLVNLQVRFAVEFDDDDEGRAAAAILPRAVEQSHAKLCTVSRTIEGGGPVSMEVVEV
ncbi:MAG: OsmC family protein [Propionibacteriaceae bacterium]|jgi:uncharacterized OsmC-like protein|nr:OsmC family protein [Propionibacteriaceae bacterium]